MTVGYKGIGWNRQKKIYDQVVVGGLLLYLAVFVGAGLILRPNGTLETLLIRALGTAALLLLHIVLAIGPLSRLDPRFLPLLYNRRHLGVVTFLTALAHGVFNIVQFHALGDTNPLVSVLVSNPRWDSVSQFPFQPLGLAALSILFLMAATSHDFWLATLTAPVWKRLHMAVYIAYALVVLHVALGVLQQETNPILVAVLAAGVATLLLLHVAAALKGQRGDRAAGRSEIDGFVDVCGVDEIPDERARVVSLTGERVAIFRYGDKVSAISNVCQHQNGPLGEGRILNGCVVCPWHGYEYRLESGSSPPPFTEKVPTFRVRIHNGRVLVDPRPNPPGTPVEPALVQESVKADEEEFYVGYQKQAPPAIAAWVRNAAVALLSLAVVLPVILIASQNRFSDAVFEYGTVRQFEGIVADAPYPVLNVEEGGASRPHYLVRLGKAGAQQDVAGLSGERVEAAGQLIYRDDQRMIELSTGSLQPIAARGSSEPAGPAAQEVSLGRRTLTGEIVDSKCYLGVMKPGRGKPHRACAARCISGGVPPILLVAYGGGTRRHYVLVGADSRPLNREVLAMVAEPIQIEGEIVRSGGLWYLKAEPMTFRRLSQD